MPNRRDICFVSGNPNKINEIKQLAPEWLNVFGLDQLDINTEIAETGKTIHENSAIKAGFIYNKFQIPCFADDTGLEVEILDGRPGVYSARYAGENKDPEANMQLLLRELSTQSNRNARFITVITYIDGAGNMKQFEGRVEGKILNHKRGEMGFGYDPIFLPFGETKTFAEMSLKEKNKISHRGRAFNSFFSFINSEA